MRALVVLIAVLALASTAGARIRAGDSIGGVRLGMTLAQVQRTLGKPLGVERDRAAFGSTRVVLHFGYAAYDVELRGRGDDLRVVSVATGLRTERTPEGIGVGSTESELLRTYRELDCGTPQPLRSSRTGRIFRFEPRECVLRGRGAETVFATRQRRRFTREERWRSATAEVYEVRVQAS